MFKVRVRIKDNVLRLKLRLGLCGGSGGPVTGWR